MSATRLRTEFFNPLRLYHVLSEFYGPSGWWPGDSPFEIIVGAVLTQNTAWANVEKAIVNLKAAGMLDLHALHTAADDLIAELIRPSGYYNIKTGRLKNLIGLVMNDFAGDLDRLLVLELHSLRTALLEVNGIGNETADSICCYAAGKPIFVVDAYTARILKRHAIIDVADYDHIQALFESGLPPDIGIYKDLHAYLVFIGKDFCRSRNPHCNKCPLNDPGLWRQPRNSCQ